MTVNPDSLAVAPCPMSRPPDVIGAAHVITSTASVIRPIANLNCDGARVSGISWAVAWPVTSVVRSVPRITSVISIASTCDERDRNQKQKERQPFQSPFCSIPGGTCFRLRGINNVRFHIMIFRIRQSFHVPAFSPRGGLRKTFTRAAHRSHDQFHSTGATIKSKSGTELPFENEIANPQFNTPRSSVTRRLGRASRPQLSQSRRCSRRLQDYLAPHIPQPCPTHSCEW